MDSIGRYGDHPFLYPVYGLGGIPEGFTRFCAIHGGTYMLNQDVDEIVIEGGKVVGVRSGDQVARAPLVVCDPSYIQKQEGHVEKTGKVVRAICILDEPIPNTDGKSSVQIIIPQKQVDRHNDIYVNMVSSSHAICAKGLYVAIVSTTVETDDPESEIQPGLDLLGAIREQFTCVEDLYKPLHDGTDNGVFITSSYDPSSHFESASEDVLDVYRRIMGTELDLNTLPEPEE
jgi:Rab GDP dissociation inhibitor